MHTIVDQNFDRFHVSAEQEPGFNYWEIQLDDVNELLSCLAAKWHIFEDEDITSKDAPCKRSRSWKPTKSRQSFAASMFDPKQGRPVSSYDHCEQHHPKASLQIGLCHTSFSVRTPESSEDKNFVLFRHLLDTHRFMDLHEAHALFSNKYSTRVSLPSDAAICWRKTR